MAVLDDDNAIERTAQSSAIGLADHRIDSYSHCVFVDSRDQTHRLEALFNPEGFPISREAEWGELNPVGWSSTTLQYAHTKSPSYTLQLRFSRVAMLERKIKYPSFEYARNFFQSFLYGKFPGRAPRFLLFVWPNTVMTTNIVRSVGMTYERWSQRGALMSYVIELSLTEMRQTFIANSDLHLESPDVLPDYTVTSVSLRDATTGTSTKMGGGNNG